jgi:hypothetical protein
MHPRPQDRGEVRRRLIPIPQVQNLPASFSFTNCKKQLFKRRITLFTDSRIRYRNHNGFEDLTEAQYKRRAWLLAFGLITGLAFSSIFLWLTQPPRAVERDAWRWRSFTSNLTQEQVRQGHQVAG